MDFEDFMLGSKETGLVIDWTQMATYNTIMSIAAGAGLVMLVSFVKALVRDKEELNTSSWAISFAVPAFVLVATGLHMTLVWPFAKYFPFDNIIFGETSLAFGVLLGAAALFLWHRGDRITTAADPVKYAAKAAQPLNIFYVGIGLALIGIGVAGVAFKLFAAPAAEPISGAFADYSMIEATFMSLLFALIGVGTVLAPLTLKALAEGSVLDRPVQKIVLILWRVTGVIFVLFGAMNFYTHIGLIVNTMG